MSFYIGFYGWILYIAVCIGINYIKWLKHIRPRYLVSNIWRAFFGFVFLVIMSARDGFNGIDPAYPRTLLPYIPHAVYIVTSFYLSFDPGLNWLRGLSAFYRGKDSGIFDTMRIGFYYTLKVVCAIGLVWSVIRVL